MDALYLLQGHEIYPENVVDNDPLWETLVAVRAPTLLMCIFVTLQTLSLSRKESLRNGLLWVVSDNFRWSC